MNNIISENKTETPYDSVQVKFVYDSLVKVKLPYYSSLKLSENSDQSLIIKDYRTVLFHRFLNDFLPELLHKSIFFHKFIHKTENLFRA